MRGKKIVWKLSEFNTIFTGGAEKQRRRKEKARGKIQIRKYKVSIHSVAEGENRGVKISFFKGIGLF
jgi:hypothetical protein